MKEKSKKQKKRLDENELCGVEKKELLLIIVIIAIMIIIIHIRMCKPALLCSRLCVSQHVKIGIRINQQEDFTCEDTNSPVSSFLVRVEQHNP